MQIAIATCRQQYWGIVRVSRNTLREVTFSPGEVTDLKKIVSIISQYPAARITVPNQGESGRRRNYPSRRYLPS